MRVWWLTIAMAAVLSGCEGTGLPELDPLSIDYDTCGGIMGLPCSDGLVCADEPGDRCHEQDGGRDCSGICITCDDTRIDRSVVSDDPRACGSLDFDCPGRQVQWFDDCGCGCQPP